MDVRPSVQTRDDVRAADMLTNNSTSHSPGTEPPNFYGSRRESGSGLPLPLSLPLPQHHSLLGSSAALHASHHHHPAHLPPHHPAHLNLSAVGVGSSLNRRVIHHVEDEESVSTPLPVITSPTMGNKDKGACSDHDGDSVDNKSTDGGRSASRSTTDKDSVRGRSPKPAMAGSYRQDDRKSPALVGNGSVSGPPTTSVATSILAGRFGSPRGTGMTSSSIIRSAAAMGWPPLSDPLFSRHHHGTNGSLIALPPTNGSSGVNGTAAGNIPSPNSMAAMAAAAAAACGVDPTTAHFGALKMYPQIGKKSVISFLTFSNLTLILKST